MNSLALNFGYVANPWVNLDYELGINFHASGSFDALMSHFAGQWVANLFKSHHEFGFYSDWIHKYRDDFKIVYVVRDAASVLRSYQRFLQTVQWNEGPKLASASDFIRANPNGSLTRFQFQFAETMTHRWCNHVNGWLQGGRTLGGCFLPIHYSALDGSFEHTMRSVAGFLNLPLPQLLKKPDRFSNVVFPSSPPAFPLEGFPLNDEDLAFLHDVCADTNQLIQDVFGSTAPVARRDQCAIQ